MADDHTSDILPDEILVELEPLEWLAPAASLKLQCNHYVPVKPGDTVWAFLDDEEHPEASGLPIYFAVDPGTIH